MILNNAGLMQNSLLERSRIDNWQQMIDVNLKSVLYGIAAVLPHITKQKSGQITNVSSVAGHKVRPDRAVYAATKAEMRMLSEGLRQEMKPHGVRTTIISPAAVTSELADSVTEAYVAENVRKFYKGHAISAESFACVVAFAISQAENFDINEILFRPTTQDL